MMAADDAKPDDFPVHSPPCVCGRCHDGNSKKDGDSPLLRALRARMTDENRLRRLLRGQS
ncbi:hypothetical protein C0R01_21280 [Streptomyces albidoflavus]|uniref:Uncharacterized protein n=1 Tax=Streptomyces albidoflavus TaxID=1886 RepID=A0AB37XA07_9ACTN|nr:hypothetical protein B9S66_09500 [Streptomyces sp. SM17]RZE36208.1 hypothetical protein C0Q91_21530 [Streptomyces albidoflavus]RZE61583.1 hypothetical protein C0R00_21320 [Streptomyces albidoflavus]RZE72768.1 hypothetical protein C0R01_21280 [Streptomyces albidoflavus]